MVVPGEAREVVDQDGVEVTRVGCSHQSREARPVGASA